MSRIKLTIFMALAILLLGCRKSSGIVYTPPALEGEWMVRMTQSGGIMGMRQSIEVTGDGRYLAADQRAGNIVKGEFTVAELAELQNLVASLEFATSQMPSVCADCFVFDVEIQSGGKKMIAQADDISLSDSGMESLVEFLREKMDAALK